MAVPDLSNAVLADPPVTIHPHPVRDHLNMTLDLAEAGEVTLDLFDPAGRRVGGVVRDLLQGSAHLRWKIAGGDGPGRPRGGVSSCPVVTVPHLDRLCNVWTGDRRPPSAFEIVTLPRIPNDRRSD